MTFIVDSPPEADDGDTPANTINTYIQDSKVALRERMSCFGSDGDSKHYDNASDNWGKHKGSVIGFAKVHESFNVMESFSPRKEGTIHIVNDGSNTDVYIVSSEGEFVRVGAGILHSDFSGLSDDGAHSQYFLEDGSRPVSSQIEVDTSGSITPSSYGSLDSSPVPSSHAESSWYDGHGVGSITKRFLDLPFTIDDLNISETENVLDDSSDDAFNVGGNNFSFFPRMSIATTNISGPGYARVRIEYSSLGQAFFKPLNFSQWVTHDGIASLYTKYMQQSVIS